MSADARGLTPYRKTHVRFDLAHNTLREAAFYMFRSAHQIAQGHAGQAASQNWQYLESNAIAIKAWQDDPSNLHWKTDSAGAIIGLSDLTTIPGYVSRPTFRAPTDLNGVTVDPSVQATGDNFLIKTVRAGDSWAQSLSSDISSFGQIPSSSTGNVSLDRHFVGKKVYGDNHAFMVRITIPASAPAYKDSVGAIYFGGPINGQGGTDPTGVYCLEFTGWGGVNLYMQEPNGSGGFVFRTIDRWVAFHRSSTTQVILCRIWPHYAADGTPLIQFDTDTAGGQSPGSGNLITSYYGGKTAGNSHVWRGWVVNGLPVTGHGPIRVDIPRQLRPPIQISVLKFLSPAFIFDDAFALDWFPTILSDLTLIWQYSTPLDSTVEGSIYDFGTGDELMLVDQGPGYKTYKINPGQSFYNAKFTLTPSSDMTKSPLLYGYKVLRGAVYGPIFPGEWDVQDTYPLAAARDYSITGPDKDYTHESASLTIDDLGGNLTRLNNRARIRTQIETEYHPTDPTLRSVLFSGYVDRAGGKQMGTIAREGLGGAGAIKQYPSPDWKRFAVTCSGVWRRLKEKLTMQRVYLLGDDGQQQPYKVTDVCRKMLIWAGFSPGEIDIPDNPTQFQPSTGGADEAMIEPLAEIGDVVAGFLHEYLGWILIYDGNAGFGGMLRAIVPPPLYGPYVPLYNISFDTPAAGKAQHRPESYGSYGWVATQPGGPGSEVNIPTVFPRKRTFEPHVKPPEANAVHVTGTGLVLPQSGGQYQLNQWAWNPKSYDFFVDEHGAPIITADPDHPDYIGDLLPVVVVNTSLSSQHTVDLLTRRVYDVSCHAQKWFQVQVPLPLVIDPNDANQRAPRPPRYYDPLTVTKGGVVTVWLTRSCNPFWRKDAFQWCHLEVFAITL